jgi:hypothetical protein
MLLLFFGYSHYVENYITSEWAVEWTRKDRESRDFIPLKPVRPKPFKGARNSGKQWKRCGNFPSR